MEKCTRCGLESRSPLHFSSEVVCEDCFVLDPAGVIYKEQKLLDNMKKIEDAARAEAPRNNKMSEERARKATERLNSLRDQHNTRAFLFNIYKVSKESGFNPDNFYCEWDYFNNRLNMSVDGVTVYMYDLGHGQREYTTEIDGIMVTSYDLSRLLFQVSYADSRQEAI